MPPKRKLEESLGAIDNNTPEKKQKIDNNYKKITTKVFDWKSRFPTVFDIHEQFSCPSPKTVLERQIMRYSRMVRYQHDWHIKIKNQDWVTEIKYKLLKKGADDAVIQYVFDELEQRYLNLIDGPIFPALVDGVYQADNMFTDQFKETFERQANEVELLSQGENFLVIGKEPDSLFDREDYVLKDLICPSICCFSVEKSKRQEEPVRLEQIVEKDAVFTKPIYEVPVESPDDSISEYSNDSYDSNEPPLEPSKEPAYQWLPAEFNIDNNGKVKVTIESYINNLHPVHYANVYDSIAQIFEKFIPLFNKTLTDVLNPTPNRIQYEEIHEDFMALNESQRSLTREISPLVPEYCPNKATSRTVVDLKGRRVQVIVKMARLDLPACSKLVNPWEVDGMPHERIIATGVYCFNARNISPMTISFREPIVPPFHVARDTDVFGLDVGAPLIQDRGTVSLQSDRCLVYPNLWQHRILISEASEFRGTMSLLYFYLVDPATPILSTAHVLPQQPSWLVDYRTVVEGTTLSQLPPELLRIIFSKYRYGFKYPKAAQHRILAIEERKLFNKYTAWQWNHRTYGSDTD